MSRLDGGEVVPAAAVLVVVRLWRVGRVRLGVDKRPAAVRRAAAARRCGPPRAGRARRSGGLRAEALAVLLRGADALRLERRGDGTPSCMGWGGRQVCVCDCGSNERRRKETTARGGALRPVFLTLLVGSGREQTYAVRGRWVAADHSSARRTHRR